MIETIQLDFLYDFDRVLDRLSMDPLISLNKEERYVLVPTEEQLVCKVQATGTTESPTFVIEGAINERQLQNIKEIFHFDRSLEPIHTHFTDTNLAPIFEEHRGTPIIREFSLYATLMKSIIHQQLNLSFAHTLTTRFVHTFGEQLDGVWFYPKPEVIGQLKVEDLRELQFSTRKAEYVIGVSQAMASGELNLQALALQDDETITQILVKYRGIGPWTAGSFLLFGLGRPNLFPLADIGLQNALKKLWTTTDKPKAEEISSHFPQWSPYLSYASLYLWRSIE
ncbi:DNA-3-methyladenine glycosylase [Paenisporosarcina sp. OV554]|uniref:DNA-3-methyladenine glycosylase family protein n=1 Tax=Paenisporosarcina sp. OV554 TaxID=2135694 RepID=UPI000D38665B|nr:DNA-3-methyladenine glycosylase [Paenisporosarcina sp. OV554]PUB17961.1 DNA-3-methyladenine glycosylase II [Paenisporosarcina sp. OV554]